MDQDFEAEMIAEMQADFFDYDPYEDIYAGTASDGFDF